VEFSIADLVSAINQNTYLPAMADDIHLARLAPESPARAPTGFLGEKVQSLAFGVVLATKLQTTHLKQLANQYAGQGSQLQRIQEN